MKYKYLPIIILIITTLNIQAQQKFNAFEKIMGQWIGSGIGYGGATSTVKTSFEMMMNGQFIEVKNESIFKPTEKKLKGEIHTDWGLISFDKQRKVFVFRQFHIEGFVNQYVLNQAISTADKLVFETEIIENFVPGVKARWTILIQDGNLVETIFDLQMPGKEFEQYGRNRYEEKK